MEFRVGEDVLIYFPVTDAVTQAVVNLTGATAEWVCGTLSSDGVTFTPVLTKTTHDVSYPILITRDPNGASQVTNTFLVPLSHVATGASFVPISTYVYELAMTLANFRVVLYPPIETIAAFTVYPSFTHDVDIGVPREIRLPIEITLPEISLQNNPHSEPEPTRQISK